MRPLPLLLAALVLAGCAVRGSPRDDPAIPGDQSREPATRAGAHLARGEGVMTEGGTHQFAYAGDLRAAVGCVAYQEGTSTRAETCAVVNATSLTARWNDSSSRWSESVFAFDASGNVVAWWLDACREWRLGVREAPTGADHCPT